MHRNEQLSERLLAFAVCITGLVEHLPKTVVGRHVGRQLLRCGTSPGANYEEARGAESKRDFVHKSGIVLKELNESHYWIRLAAAAKLVKPTKLAELLDEARQLVAIFGKSLSTARK